MFIFQPFLDDLKFVTMFQLVWNHQSVIYNELITQFLWDDVVIGIGSSSSPVVSRKFACASSSGSRCRTVAKPRSVTRRNVTWTAGSRSKMCYKNQRPKKGWLCFTCSGISWFSHQGTSQFDKRDHHSQWCCLDFWLGTTIVLWLSCNPHWHAWMCRSMSEDFKKPTYTHLALQNLCFSMN